MNQIVSSAEFNGTAFFYADPTFVLGSIEKGEYKTLMVSVDYTSWGINVTSVSFEVNTQTNPYLSVTTPTVANNILTFVLSGGLPGTDYELSITTIPYTRTDTLIIHVPEDTDCCTSPQSNTYNTASQNATIYVNGAPRYFIANIPPTNANVMDQWYYPPTGALYEYITDGSGVNFWWRQIPPYIVPGTPVPSGVMLYQEQLTVTAANTLSPLSHTPTGPVTLFINRQVFTSTEVPAPFTVSGVDIDWLSSITTLLPNYMIVIASYVGVAP